MTYNTVYSLIIIIIIIIIIVVVLIILIVIVIHYQRKISIDVSYTFSGHDFSLFFIQILSGHPYEDFITPAWHSFSLKFSRPSDYLATHGHIYNVDVF